MEANLLLFGGVGAFLAAALLVFVIADYVLDRQRVRARLRQLPEIELSPREVQERELAAPITQRLIAPGFERLAHRTRRYAPAGMIERLEGLLQQAGSPPAWDGERLFAAKIVTAVAVLALTIFLAPILGFGFIRTLIGGAIVVYAGWMVPEWVVRSRATERQKKIQRALPDALDLLSISVTAGLGFDAAVDRVAREMGGPLGDELRRMLREMQLGRSRHEALRQLSDRNDIPDLDSFVLAMIQADIFGISISRVLEVQSGEMRIKRRQRAEEQAQKVPVKILFPVILCIFPALFVVILGPAVIDIYRALIA